MQQIEEAIPNIFVEIRETERGGCRKNQLPVLIPSFSCGLEKIKSTTPAFLSNLRLIHNGDRICITQLYFLFYIVHKNGKKTNITHVHLS